MTVNNPHRKIMVLSGIIGLLLIVPLCYDMVSGIVLGVNNNTELFDTRLGYEPYPVYLEIEPTASRMEMLGSRHGLLGYMDVQREGIFFVNEEVISPAVTTATAILSLAAVLCAIYYIFSIVKIAPIIARQGLMNAAAVRQLRHVSYSMLLSYILFAASTYLPTWYYSLHIDLTQYNVCYPRISESLVTAIILILLTEILNITRKLKEEQELTI